jgi:hypothetical protein
LETRQAGKALQPHQQRVVAEKHELDEKIDKLKAFIMESPIFQKLPDDERSRLNRQYDVMVEYSRILGARIEAF